MTERKQTLLLLLPLAALVALMTLWLRVRSTTPKAEVRNAVISIRVDAHKPDGLDWDLPDEDGSRLPDPTVCVTVDGARHCSPDGTDLPMRAACENALHCDIEGLDVPTSGAFSVTVWDIDKSSSDIICDGKCEYGHVCNLQGCTVAVGATATDLGREAETTTDASSEAAQ